MKYKTISLIFLFSISITGSATQSFMGNIRGLITDRSGVAIQIADITATDVRRNNTYSAEITSKGDFSFINLPPGIYQVKVDAPGFKSEVISNVHVELSRTTDLYIKLYPGVSTQTVSGIEDDERLVQTTTPDLQTAFNNRDAVEFPQTTFAGKNSTESGLYNLALLSTNVSEAGSVGEGVGGSVGGQRTRYNNFVLDGIDNNRKDISGPALYITPEAIEQFSLIKNQFTAEFARSIGGQFIGITKLGRNDIHGTAYGFFRNRHLNSLDTLQKNAGVIRDDKVSPANASMPRYDYARYGFNFSGPVYLPNFRKGGGALLDGRDRLFFFTAFERQQLGMPPATVGFMAPTVEGFSKLDVMPGLSKENLSFFKKYVTPASMQGMTVNTDGTKTPQYIYVGTDTCPCDVNSPFYIPIGSVKQSSPQYSYRYNFVLNLDYIWTEYTQHHGRLIYDRLRETAPGASLPAFQVLNPTSGWLFSYTLNHYFTPKLINEFRIGYRRYDSSIAAPNIPFPISGFDSFPNIGIRDIGIGIGPNVIAPQSTTENNYQLVENVSYLKGSHSIRWGGDIRKLIAPQVYAPGIRGNYQYNTTNRFLQDFNPDYISERTIGNSTYYGDQILLYLYGQDEWRYRQNLTFIFGLNYVYQQVPYSARQQTLNSMSSIPGVLAFDEPKSQKTNFGPRIGIAYSPSASNGVLKKLFGENHQSSIRAGFGMAYDIIIDHLYSLSMPLQYQTTINYPPVNDKIPDFLAEGGIPNTIPPIKNIPAVTRANTNSWIPDQKVPYSIVWNLTYQRQFMKDWIINAQYLGTRGVHLPIQNQINVNSRVTDSFYLPTFNTKPSDSEIDSLQITLSELKKRPLIITEYADAGFINPITAFIPAGNSTYHGFSAQVNRRLSRGGQLFAAYTWSHLIDDSTAEVFSTVLSPRRPQDFQDLRDEKAASMMDRRHRFAVGGIYDLSMFGNSSGRLKRVLLDGFTFAGALTFESGEYATVLSGVDSNLNDDTVGDRAILNVNGVAGTASAVSPLMKKCPVNLAVCPSIYNDARTVGYLVNNSNAQYVQAGPGARSTSGRNTLKLPGINNFDFSIIKNFAATEKMKIQFRADFINMFNHPQHIPGSPDTVMPVPTLNVGTVNTVSSSIFNKSSQVFSSNPRIIQLALRWLF